MLKINQREGNTVRDFKVGDKVKVEFEGTLLKMPENSGLGKYFYRVVDNFGNSFILPENHLTLIEPASLELEVGQTWRSTGGYDRTIRIIENDRVCYWNHFCKNFNDCSIEVFIEDYAHKLIGEPNET